MSTNLTQIQVKRLNENALIPTRNKKTDAGIDIYASENCFIPLNGTAIIKTGIAILIPEGFVGKIEDRSSLAAKGLRTGAGVVDAGYAGEVGIVLHNITNKTSLSKDGKPGFEVLRGDKVAQLLLYKVETPNVQEIKELWSSERGNKRFGSSGR